MDVIIAGLRDSLLRLSTRLSSTGPMLRQGRPTAVSQTKRSATANMCPPRRPAHPSPVDNSHVSSLLESPRARPAETRSRHRTHDVPNRPPPVPQPELGGHDVSSHELWRYLPISLAATAAVVAGPALIVTAAIPQRGIAVCFLSAALAAIGSLLFATVGAALWKRSSHSRDVLFSELMLWSWLRRNWAERRLSQQRELFEQACRTGSEIDIDELLRLSRLLEARNPYVHGHSRRVARHAVRVARAIGLSKEQVAQVRVAAEVHDIGKLFTPQEILNNPGPLTDTEYAVIQEHAARGAEMLEGIADAEITAMVRHHHERIDGYGYPDGLRDAEIPIGARIIAVADTFDAITSARAYRSARSHKLALDVLERESGLQLDAAVATAFIAGYSSRRSIAAVTFLGSGLQRLPFALQSASLGSVAPAVGVAGALALTPLALNGVATSSPWRAQAGRARQAISTEASRPRSVDVAVTGGERLASPSHGPTGARRAQPVASIGNPPRSERPAAGVENTPGSSTTPHSASQAPVSQAGGGASSAPPSSQAPAPAPTPAEPPASVPPVAVPTVPPVSTPAIPSVTTPSISTPTVSTPPVLVGPASVPPVTVPSVTIPSIATPSLPSR